MEVTVASSPSHAKFVVQISVFRAASGIQEMLNIQLLYDAAADYGHNYQYCYYDYYSFPLTPPPFLML